MTAKQSQTRRQHFIPQLLLNGFASRIAGDQVYVWCFRKGTSPFEPNIINIAAARDFHGRDGIEEKLAEDEGAYAELLAELRRGDILPGREQLIAEFVSQMIVRTKHLRDGLATFVDVGMPVLVDGLCDPANEANVVEWVRREAEQRFKGRPGAERRRLDGELRRFVSRQLAHFREQRASGMPPAMAEETAARSQLKALAGPAAAIARTEMLRQLTWSVVKTDAAALILGDIGPIARGEGKSLLDSPLEFNTTVPIASYLPISGECLLVGRRTPGPIDSIEDINMASAELSREFFVSRRNTERERAYHPLIGRRAEFMKPDEIRRKATEVFRAG